MLKSKLKYGNKKVVLDGIKFDSKAESLRYVYLVDLEKRGVIKNLELQPAYLLQPTSQIFDLSTVKSLRGILSRGTKKSRLRQVKYFADFRYVSSEGKLVIEDVKGMPTNVYKLKKKLFLANYLVDKNIIFIEVKVRENKKIVFDTLTYSLPPS